MSTGLPWVPPPPTYFADDRSRVKFSLLEQGPFSGLLQVWQVPVSCNPTAVPTPVLGSHREQVVLPLPHCAPAPCCL